MTLFAAALSFILGSLIGSFLSVILYRLDHKDKPIIFGRSICQHSGKKLRALHLVPVLSWIFLRGRSAYTGEKISVNYILLELVTGLTFLTIFFTFNFVDVTASSIDPNILNYSIYWPNLASFIYHAALFSFFILIFFYDLVHQEIPDQVSIPAIALAVAGSLVFGIPSITSMLIGLVAISGFFALQFVVSKGQWIGGGDIRLGALIGAFLGWKLGILAVILAYFMGAIFSVALLLKKKVSRKSAIPFGPFLITGTYVATFYGNEILSWYLNTLS